MKLISKDHPAIQAFEYIYPKHPASVIQWGYPPTKELYNPLSERVRKTNRLIFLRTYKAVLQRGLDDVLANPETAEIPKDIPELLATCAALSQTATADNFNDFVRYLNRLSVELEVFTLKQAILRDRTLGNSTPFVEWCKTSRCHRWFLGN
jgi:hypothetical protein